MNIFISKFSKRALKWYICFALTLKVSLIKIDLKAKMVSKVALFGAFSNNYKTFNF